MTRFHDLDALRGCAMLLGILLHTGLFLVPLDSWPVLDAWARATPLEANGYAIALSAVHGFRMPVFFLLSGFFHAMLWQSRGLGHLARHRIERIGLPLLAGMLTIVPVIDWLVAGPDFTLIDWPLAWLDGVDHLWFLSYLLLMAALLTVAAALGLRFRHSLWWMLIPLAVAPHYLMHQMAFGPDTENGLIPDPDVFGYYALFFAFGVFVHQRKIAVRRWWTVALAPALLLVFPAGMILLYRDWPAAPAAGWTWGAVSALQAAYAWLMCFGTLGLFRWLAAKERFWVRYLSDASYWLYLCHLPLVIGAQMLVVSWPVSVHLKFVLINTVVIAGLLAVYQAGVRHSLVGTVLHGPRARRRGPAPRSLAAVESRPR